MSNTIHLIARTIALPDKVELVKAILLELIEPTRQETGCIKYELLQNQSDPTEFTIVEEWASDEALQAHGNSAHLKTAVSKLENVIAGPLDVRRYDLLA
jgi:quinol monooxygenase YgiN